MNAQHRPVVLDAWPIVRFAIGEPAIVDEVGSLFRTVRPPIVSSINLGEVYYTLAKRSGFAVAEETWRFFCSNAQVEEPTLAVTHGAARLVVRNRIPWADAHAAATAMAHGAVVWVGDAHLNKPGPWKRRDLRNLD